MIDANITELRGLARDLSTASDRVGRKVAAAVRKAAAGIEATAKANAPVLTGELRDSISVTVTGDGRHTAMQAEIGPTALQGRFVEYGTVKMPPQPFLLPALDQHTPDLERALDDAARDIL